MGCRNNTCTNTDNSGSVDTALMDTLAQLLGSDELQVQMKEEISETLTQDNFNIIFVYNNFIDYVNKYVCCLTGSWSPLMGDAVLHAG